MVAGKPENPRIGRVDLEAVPDGLQVMHRLPWLSMTPFGSLVEPEVYCKNARLSAVISG